jgi:hypothetical protein
MALQIEWRSRADGDDALLAVEPNSNTVLKTWEVDAALLTDFLNDMGQLEKTGRDSRDVGQEDPEHWGELVIARSESGDVLDIDPERYWGGIAYWFRSRGSDPHLWRERR